MFILICLSLICIQIEKFAYLLGLDIDILVQKYWLWQELLLSTFILYLSHSLSIFRIDWSNLTFFVNIVFCGLNLTSHLPHYLPLKKKKKLPDNYLSINAKLINLYLFLAASRLGKNCQTYKCWEDWFFWIDYNENTKGMVTFFSSYQIWTIWLIHFVSFWL